MAHDYNFYASWWLGFSSFVVMMLTILFASKSDKHTRPYIVIKRTFTATAGFGCLMVSIGYHLTHGNCIDFVGYSDWLKSLPVVGYIFQGVWIDCKTVSKAQIISSEYNILVLLPLAMTALLMWSFSPIYYKYFGDRRKTPRFAYKGVS